MADRNTVVLFRVRYSETDQMGTFYNSRVLEWFECGRTEFLRAAGVPYAQMEQQGVCLPLVESHIKYQGRARYDDQLQMICRAQLSGRARVRFDLTICHQDHGAPVAQGYTVHAVTNETGRAMRPPDWFVAALQSAPDLVD